MIRVFLLFLFVFSACSNANNHKKYFVCDVLPDDFREKVNPNRPFDGALNYWDRTFYYHKTADGDYETHFPLYGGTPLGIKLNDDVLSGAYLKVAREQRGFYREIFDVYRFDMKKRILVHSYVYYMKKEDYDKNLSSPSFVPDNHPFLFDMIDREAPENYKKIGWDKTKWQCYEMSYFRYLKFQLKSILYLFTA